MNSVDFVLGLHCHQPVGNFPEVFEQAYRDAYLPFIETFERYPAVKAVLHYTGPLWQFFLEEHPDFVARLAALATAGRVEFLGGGFYEPILTVIPGEDACAQLARMRDFLQRHIGQTPQGAWLAERVWEPQLPSLLRSGGIRYLAVDDTHFHRVGVTAERLAGHYLTEDQGQSVAVFPISTALRYIIPFRPVPQVLDHFREEARRRKEPLRVLVDDGEKFGVWPGTNRWVYERGWLEQFFQALSENVDWLRTVTLRQAYDEREAVGHVYLPTTSYFELGEWALPQEGQQHLAELKSLLGHRVQEFEALIAAGYWRGFLAKYPEANYMHKRMLRLSDAVRRLPASYPDREEAREHVLKAQSNDAYWHGLFGGVYLPHLRDAVWHHLLSAERLARNGSPLQGVEHADVDVDGHEEIVLRDPAWTAVVAPHKGGTLVELSHMGIPFNFLNTMARRPEGYHAQVRNATTGSEEGARSIHERATAKQPGLERYLQYDRHRRASLIDHLLLPQATWEDLAAGREAHVVALARRPYAVSPLEQGRTGIRTAHREELPDSAVTVRKSIILGNADDAVEVHWDIEHHGDHPTKLRFGTELNLALLAGDAPDRYLEVPGRVLEDPKLASAGEERDVRTLRCINRWDGWILTLDITPGADLWRYPVHTVNNSEAGFELVYQATCAVFVWEVVLPREGHWHGQLRITVRQSG